MVAKKSINSETDSSFTFDWNLIQSFLAVIDAGSLLGAARQTGISQPTIGRHIEALETQLGVSLFARTGRALVPTANARQIADIARSMELGATQIAHSITNATTNKSGLVRITASRTVALHLLPDFALQLQREAPEIDLAIVASDEITNLLRRDADIAIRMVRPKQADVITKRLGAFTLTPCACQSYVDRWGMPRSMADLYHHRFVAPDKDKFFVGKVRELAQAKDNKSGTFKLAFRTDDFATQAAAIRAGVGIGFVADFLLDQYDDLLPIPVELPLPDLPVWLAVHQEIRSTPRIRAVFDSLQKYLKARLG